MASSCLPIQGWLGSRIVGFRLGGCRRIDHNESQQTMDYEVRANTGGGAADDEFIVRITSGRIEFPNPRKPQQLIDAPVEAFAGAVFSESTRVFNATVELAFVRPEPILRPRLIYWFQDGDEGSRVVHELNTAAGELGIRAELIASSAEDLTIVRGGRVYVGRLSMEKNWKGSREYRVADVQSVSRRRQAIDVVLKSGERIRGMPVDTDVGDMLVELLAHPDSDDSLAARNTSSGSISSELERLAQLYQQGFLTEDEFSLAKEQVVKPPTE